MSDREWIEPIVERVVSQVLDSHAAQVRSEIVQRVMEEVAAQPAPPAAPAASHAAELARAVSDIQAGTSQKEILRALLDSSACCAARLALFVVKGGHATGWQGRGFANGESIKDFALDSTVPAVLRAIGDRVAASAAGAEFDARFLDQFGTSAGEARLLPLILKDKVAALVYADGGTDGTPLDASSLEVLVLSASAWLEVNALRKQAHKEQAVASAEVSGAPVHETTPALNDPFAAHAPAYAMAAAASAGAPEAVAAPAPTTPVEAEVAAEAQSAEVEMQSVAVAEPEGVAEPLPVGQTEPVVEPEIKPEAVSQAPETSGEEQQIHNKAQRFARLLVDEIKLYNQAKVSEGRKNKDLYDRLKDTIEKSGATYQKRYGNTVAASGNYFQHELIRSLAEDDASIMGENFHL
jgi:hypothetical protein